MSVRFEGTPTVADRGASTYESAQGIAAVRVHVSSGPTTPGRRSGPSLVIRTAELSPHRPEEIENAEEAALTVTHAGGSENPITFVRSWDGEAKLYANLARHLPSDLPLYTIGPPRWEDYARYPRDVAAWAAWCRERLRAIPHPGPYVLGGISFGGVIARELARQLVAEGCTVNLVVLIDSRLPRGHPFDERPRRSVPHRVVYHLNNLFEAGPGKRVPYLKEKAGWQLHHLATWVTSVRARLGWLAPGEEPPPTEEIHAPADLPPLQRCLWRAYLKYKPEVSTIPMALFWTDESRGHTSESTLGWSPWQLGPLETQRIDGKHLEVLVEPHASGVARLLQRSLAWAGRDPDQP